jgi:hypothetical protein
MTSGRRVAVTVGAIAVALGATAYLTLPLIAHERAEVACQMRIPGDGSYTIEWKPLPPAHWECVATPEGEPTRIIDLGWWPV